MARRDSHRRNDWGCTRGHVRTVGYRRGLYRSAGGSRSRLAFRGMAKPAHRGRASGVEPSSRLCVVARGTRHEGDLSAHRRSLECLLAARADNWRGGLDDTRRHEPRGARPYRASARRVATDRNRLPPSLSCGVGACILAVSRGGGHRLTVMLAGALWVAAFGLFVIAYTP